MRGQMRSVEPEVFLHGLTTILPSVGDNVRLVPSRTESSSVLDTILSGVLQDTVEEGVGVEKGNIGVCVLLLECGGLVGEDGVELVNHVGVW